MQSQSRQEGVRDWPDATEPAASAHLPDEHAARASLSDRSLSLIRRSRALANIARDVVGVATPAEWATRVVTAVESATGWHRVLLFRLSERADTLELIAARGVPAEQERLSARWPLDSLTLSALTARRRQPVVSGRGEIPPAVVEHAARFGIGAFAVLPLRAHGRVLGALTLLSEDNYPIDDEELDFLRAVADQVAAGLENARLYKEARRREAQARFLTKVADLFASSLNPQIVLQSILQRCVGVLGDGCGIFLNPPEPKADDRLVLAAVHHRRAEMVPRIREILVSIPFRLGRGGVGTRAANGEPRLVPDLTDPALGLSAESLEWVRRIEARSCLIVPLRTRRVTLGVLVCVATVEPDATTSPAPLVGAPVGGPLTNAELALAVEVGTRAATALENAQLYAAAEDARLWLRTVFNQLVDGVLVLDREGRIVDSNAAAARLLGRPLTADMSPAERRDLLDVRAPDGTPLPVEEFPGQLAFTRGEPVMNVEMLVVHPNGTQHEISASASPLHDEGGHVLGAVTVLHDVSELRRLERAKDNFLSVASHELRTPLTPLKGLTQILLRHLERVAQAGEPIDMARLERYLRTMDGQVDRLAGLVNDLLDVSRIRTGRMELRRERVDLVALTATALERFAAVAQVEISIPKRDALGGGQEGRQGAQVEAREQGPLEVPAVSTGQAASIASKPSVLSAPVPAGGGSARSAHAIRFEPKVRRLIGCWDPARLEQVIANLIANSIKYSPAGGQIRVTLRPQAKGDAAEAHLAFTDPGIGIPRAQIAELFRPFVRLANAPAEHFGGLGLGLYIAYDIVERHGGRIWADSPGPGKGSTFHVVLPVAPKEGSV